MLGEIGSSRSVGSTQAEPKGGSFTLREFEGAAVLSPQPSALAFNSIRHSVSSRIGCNSMKTNDGCHVYSTQTRKHNFLGFSSLRGEKIHSALSSILIRSKLGCGRAGIETING